MNLFRSGKEHGQVLVIIALSAIVIFGFVGLAIDGGLKFSDRRHAQNAADSAALAAALAKLQGWEANVSDISPTTSTQLDCPPPAGDLPSDLCASLLTAGLDRANSNGYDNNPVTNTVEVYSPPTSGYYSTVSEKDNYVQVIITSHVKTAFMSVLGITSTDNIVQAVAFTKKSRTLGDGAMIIAYEPHPNCSSGNGTNNGTVNVGGNTGITLDGGGIFVNSQEPCGFTNTNCATLNISNGGINSAGDNIDQDGCSNAAPAYPNQEPVIIPDDVQYPPEPPECNIAATANNLGPDPLDPANEAWLIHPGFYTDFPQASIVPNNKHIYLASGVYCIDPTANHDLQWNSQAFLSLNGSTDPTKNPYQDPSNPLPDVNPNGVTLYIKCCGGFTFNVNSPIYLDASNSSSSAYQGYLIILQGTPTMNPRPSCVINGGSYLDINGLIFTPYCDITVNGGNSSIATINAEVVGWTVNINGNSGLTFHYDPSNKIKIKRRIGLMK